MKTKRILIGGIVAGIAMFFLGWLIYGIALSDFMSEACDHSNSRPMDQMIWWALIASNFAWGFLLAILIDWTGNLAPAGGAKLGAVLAFFAALGFDLAMYAMSTMYANPTVILVDSIAYAVLFGISGALTAWVMNKVK